MPPDSYEIVLGKERLDPDRHRVNRERSDSREDPSNNRGQREKHIKGGIDLECSSNVEAFDVDSPVCLPVSEEQAGNQESAEYEEQVHACPANLRPPVKILHV